MLTRVRAFAHIRAGAGGIGNFPGEVNGAQAQTQSLQAQLQILQQLQMLQQTQVATLHVFVFVFVFLFLVCCRRSRFGKNGGCDFWLSRCQ